VNAVHRRRFPSYEQECLPVHLYQWYPFEKFGGWKWIPAQNKERPVTHRYHLYGASVRGHMLTEGIKHNFRYCIIDLDNGDFLYADHP